MWYPCCGWRPLVEPTVSSTSKPPLTSCVAVGQPPSGDRVRARAATSGRSAGVAPSVGRGDRREWDSPTSAPDDVDRLDSAGFRAQL
jgi:hypothetical protein